MLIAFVIARPRPRSYTQSRAFGREVGGVLIIERCVRRGGRTVPE